MRLRTSLFLLSAATALPILVFALLAAGLVVQRENENLINAAKARNQATMSAVDAELQGAIGALQAVSHASILDGEAFQAFHEYAKGVLATQPSWQNIVLQDRSGRQLVNARVPWGSELPSRGVELRSLEATVRTARPAISDLRFAPLLNNEPGIAVRVPVVRSDGVAYVLTAVLGVRAFQRLLVSQQLPADWVSGLVDSQGRLIARVPDTPAGKMASADYLQHVREAREGWYRGRTIEGDDTYTAFLKSDLTGWSIGYAVPAEAVLGGAVRAAWLVAGGMALSLAAAALIGLWLGRLISQPMSELADAASLLPTGVVPRRMNTEIDEVHRLAAAFERAGETIAARDSELRRSGEELRQQAAELRRADVNKSRFLALLAHELRNPLAPLLNGLAILERTRDPQRLESTRAMMQRQVAHMTRLIEDLLDVSRIDRGQLELRRERVDIEAVVRSAIETAKPGIEARQQVLVVRDPAEPLCVDGDPVRLSQIVANLLNNASKFSPNESRIEISMCAEGEDAIVAVKDHGIGFDSRDGQRIFDMFVQLDGGRGRATGGLGIGLTLVRSLAELHGGRVEATSNGPGMGATFEVRLPLARASSKAAQVPSPIG
jgi:signal transduction histidine kinase